MKYTAEQYLERIENKRLNSTPLYSKKEMIDFAEKYAKQCDIHGVVKSLPTDEEIYSEGCKYVREIEQPNRQPLITLRQIFKAGAMFVKKQLDN